MPCLRYNFATGRPASHSPNIPTNRLYVNLDFIISITQRNRSRYFQLGSRLRAFTDSLLSTSCEEVKRKEASTFILLPDSASLRPSQNIKNKNSVIKVGKILIQD